MIQAKQELRQALQAALSQLAGEAGMAAPVAAFESPKQASHGDLAITAAMPLARPLKKNPRELAQRLVDLLNAQPAVQKWVSALEIAGPGFINLRLAPAAKQAVVSEVLAGASCFGLQAPSGQKVMVEFVSANPTGPLHVGHGRNAALGDCICNLLQTQGAEVLREFYYNDAGVQISTLATSTQSRLKGLKPGDADWPESAYNGEYIGDIAADFAAKKTVHADDRAFTASGDPDDMDSIRQFAVAYLRHEQDLDLQAFGVRFDHYYLESSLYSDGRVEDTVKRLVAAGKTFEEGGALWLRTTEYGDDKDRVMRKQDGTFTYFVPDVAYLRHEQDLDLRAFGVRFDHYYLESSLYTDGRVDDTVRRLVAAGKTYEKDGALWLRSTDYGDDKDRVMRKSDGSYTYFVPDVAYHIAKFERGFGKVINVQGTDHHGTVARVRAGLQAAGVGIPEGYPDYALYKMITVMRGGQEVKISKRSGSYVTLRDLIDWTSRDAVRFFLISRKADTEFVFDIDLALQASDENPVFYVQYAHARICSVLAQYARQKGESSVAAQALAGADLSRLTAPTEVALLQKLSEFPDMLARAAAELTPHDVAFYLRDLAAALHSWYAAERFLVDDAVLARSRMALLAATRQVLRNALAVLGVGAPEHMVREAAAAEEALP